MSYDPLRLSPCSEDLYTRVKHIHMSLTNVTLLPPKPNTHTSATHTHASITRKPAYDLATHKQRTQHKRTQHKTRFYACFNIQPGCECRCVSLSLSLSPPFLSLLFSLPFVQLRFVLVLFCTCAFSCCRLDALVCLPTTRPAFALARLLLPLVVAACMPLCVCQLPDPPLYLRVFALLPLYLRVL